MSLEKVTVKWFNKDKGYGFITRSDDKDVFAHYSAIRSKGFRTLEEVQRVSFDVIEDKRGPKADNVMALDWEVVK